MTTSRYSTKYLLTAAMAGAVLGFTLCMVAIDKPAERNEIAVLKNKIQALEQERNRPIADNPTPDQTLDIEQLRKDLSTRFIGDPRTLSEKLRDFIAEKSLPQSIAVASKVVFDLAQNPDALSNQELGVLYQSQTDQEFKRVLAQVSSYRGDNSLIEKWVAEAQVSLSSPDANERRIALIALAKTHYAGAATMITPAVQDDDIAVRLDAILALRATGNESHLPQLETLINHPDQSVSWAANDAIKHLENLSVRARTRIALEDIEAQLPPL